MLVPPNFITSRLFELLKMNPFGRMAGELEGLPSAYFIDSAPHPPTGAVYGIL
jgi:hypothetical protein